MLGKAHAFLQPFASATLYAKGEKSSISQSLPLIDALLVHYERKKVGHTGYHLESNTDFLLGALH